MNTQELLARASEIGYQLGDLHNQAQELALSAVQSLEGQSFEQDDEDNESEPYYAEFRNMEEGGTYEGRIQGASYEDNTLYFHTSEGTISGEYATTAAFLALVEWLTMNAPL